MNTILNVPQNAFFAMSGSLFFLCLATVIVIIKNYFEKTKDFSELNLRMRSWWIIILVIFIPFIINIKLAILMIGLISYLSLKEYLSLIPVRTADRRVLFWAYISIPIQLYFIYTKWYNMFYLFVPLYMFIIIPLRMITIGEVKYFLRAAGTIQWGLMITVFSIGHLSALLTLDLSSNASAGSIGAFLFLVIITELNDVFQYVFGKLFGKRKIIPKVSPNKTWAGFIGGLSMSVILSTLLSPFLTPFTLMHGVAIGFIIGIAGFFGDLIISCLKRDLGIKDTGTLIPGHGGILDRVDSLIFTAPLFFHFTNYFYG